MTLSRRAVVCAAALALADLASGEQDDPRSPAEIADLVRQSHEGHAALVRGDLEGYRSRVSYSEDFSFFGPFGGNASRVANFTEDRMHAMAATFRNGEHQSDVIEVYESPGLVVIVLVERSTVEVANLPRQDWWLRVTLVYRLDDGRWRLAHRHADPLRMPVTLAESAALAGRRPG